MVSIFRLFKVWSVIIVLLYVIDFILNNTFVNTNLMNTISIVAYNNVPISSRLTVAPIINSTQNSVLGAEIIIYVGLISIGVWQSTITDYDSSSGE